MGGASPIPPPTLHSDSMHAQEDKFPSTFTDLGEEMVPDVWTKEQDKLTGNKGSLKGQHSARRNARVRKQKLKIEREENG